MERDDRIDVTAAEQDPSLASTLELCDLEKALTPLARMHDSSTTSDHTKD
jgi:hypothetical protein